MEWPEVPDLPILDLLQSLKDRIYEDSQKIETQPLFYYLIFLCVILFIIKKNIKLKIDQIENQIEYFEIINKYNKIENELVVYENEFNDKYVDDGYDAY